LVSSIFGGKTTVQDTGVMIGAGTVGGIAQNGLVSQSYVDTKKSGGWFSSDKYNTATKALGAEVDAQFAKVIMSLSASVKTAADLLGVGSDAFTQHLNSFVVDLGKISLKDLNGEEIQKALETIFSKLGDDMAQFGVGGLEQFQQVGEGYFETLTRVATNYANLNSIQESVGTTFGATGMASIAARERLIELTGGIDQLASQTSSFASNFLSQAEQLAPVQKYVTDALAAMGLQGIDTRDKFKDAVLGLANSGALATEAGAKQYTALLALADAFAKTHAATVDLSRTEQDIADERKDLQSQYDQLAMTSAQLREKERAGIAASNLALYDSIIALKDQAKAAELLKDKATDLLADVDGAFAVLQRLVEDQKAANAKAHEIEMKSIQKRIDAQTASITKLKSLSDSLKSSLDQMAVSGTGADGGRAAAQAQLAAALAIAKAGGPLPAADALKSALSVVTKDASDQFATYDEYLADFYKTQNSIAALGRVTDSALTVEQKTLDLLQAQKDANQAAYEAETERLNELVESTRTQIDVLKGVDTSLLTIDQTLQAVLGAIRDAKANSIIAANAGIAKSYQEGLGRTQDKAGLEYWQQQAAAGMSPDAIDSLIKGSDEAQVQKLYKDLLGRNADAGGLNYWLKVMQSGSSIDDVKAAIKADAEYQKLNGVPGFAAGGSFAGGMRLVGERGPEWEVTGPSRIFNADQTAAMLRQFSNPSDNSTSLLAELRAQRVENADLRQMLESHLYAIAKSTLNAADTLEAVANGDLTFSTEEAE
jgi:hypothetical protein